MYNENGKVVFHQNKRADFIKMIRYYFNFDEKSLSHPIWVRGLKSHNVSSIVIHRMSHPTWMRGFKFW